MDELYSVIDWVSSYSSITHKIMLHLDSTGSEYVRNRPRAPRFSVGQPSWIQIDKADIVTSIITILFGAVHCLAWNFRFPSETERLLWRIAALVTTVSPIGWTAVYTMSLIDDLEGIRAKRITVASINWLSTIVVPLYLVARVLLLLIAFISLRSLPRAAYETVYWTTFIPYV